MSPQCRPVRSEHPVRAYRLLPSGLRPAARFADRLLSLPLGYLSSRLGLAAARSAGVTHRALRLADGLVRNALDPLRLIAHECLPQSVANSDTTRRRARRVRRPSAAECLRLLQWRELIVGRIPVSGGTDETDGSGWPRSDGCVGVRAGGRGGGAEQDGQLRQLLARRVDRD